MTGESAIKKHILVVDDEPDFAALLRSILVKAGYTVAVAYNSEDALSQVSRSKPDLITLDIQMPKRSGAFFYRKLKTDETFRDIPVVVVTGLTRDREMENIVKCFLEPEHVPHPEAYVEKPIDGPRFLETVAEAIRSGSLEHC